MTKTTEEKKLAAAIAVSVVLARHSNSHDPSLPTRNHASAWQLVRRLELLRKRGKLR